MPSRAARATQPRIGTAGWSIRREQAELFGSGQSHLARYATRFNAVEINSSFYRPHRPSTYARWADSVPDTFRFAAKAPRLLTHEKRLVDATAALDAFVTETRSLGDKLGPILVQLPPSLSFDAGVAFSFFTVCRDRVDGAIVCEPRHASWFASEADELLAAFRVSRVVADPPPVPAGRRPGGWKKLAYLRLHGSPRMYYSSYAPDYLEELRRELIDLQSAGIETWCIFDNTALGAATRNALETVECLTNRHP